MTAANLIVRDRAAYLLTDSATLSARDHAVLSLERKVIASGRLRLAVTSTGETWDSKGAVIEDWLAQQVSADKAVAALPGLVSMLKADLEAYYRRHRTPMRPATEWPPPHVFHLFVAIWSEAQRRPEGYAISSRGSAFYPHINVMSGFVYQTEQQINPPADAPEDPERDGLALLEAQRAWTDADGMHIVGGTAQLTTVSEAGVSMIILRQWPDQIGKPISLTGDAALV